ncbi:MAG: TonB-dependent receptor, partial [Gammaproteobacteria bacterium]|nr:TonB-dependent receptor [Gammaproteobacteria bacterium]
PPSIYKSSYSASALLLMLLTSGMAYAEEKLHVLIDDGQINTRIGEVDRSVTSSVNSVIEADRLQNNFVSLPEVLEQEVGVQMRSSGGEGSLSTLVLRGASSEQVIIYLDGVPLNNASGSPVDLSLIPVSSIERIEIYRGSTPLALGNPSIGGAVNIITRQSVKAHDGEGVGQLSASIASFHTYKLSGSSALSYDEDDVLLSVSYLQSENDFSFVNDNGTQYNLNDDRVEDRNNDGVQHLAFLANWKHRINMHYGTELRLDVYDREKEIPSVSNAETQAVLDTQQYDFLAQLNAREAWGKDSNLNLKLFSTRKNEEFDDSLRQFGFFSQQTKSVTVKSGAQLYAEKNKRFYQWKFITNLSKETYDMDSSVDLVESGINTRERIELSVENISHLYQRRFIVNVVARYQVISDEISSVSDGFGVVTPASDENYELLNPQIGAKYLFDKKTYLTANIGQYNRTPSFYELFGGNGMMQGNLDLKQESSLNADVGFTYTWYRPYHWLHDAEVYAGVYYNRIKDLIVRIYNGQGVGVPKNISDAVVQGFESTLKIRPSKNHVININISLIDSINKSDIGSFDGNALPGYYQQSFNLHYAYTIDRWLLSMDAEIKRNMYYDRSNLLQGDDVNLLNASVRRNFKNSNINFEINNIFDEDVRYFRNRPTPGISCSLTYTHNF